MLGVIPAMVPKGLRLTVELIPTPLHYISNIRTILPTQDWDRLRHACYRSARYHCEICHAKGSPPEAHEVWKYETDGPYPVQRLVRLICLCGNCHGVKHFGRSTIMGHAEEAREHFCVVNGLTSSVGRQRAKEYLTRQMQMCRTRSLLRDWRLVVDWNALAFQHGVKLSVSGVREYTVPPLRMGTR